MKSDFEKHYSTFSRCDPKAFEVDSNGDYKLKTVKDAWQEWKHLITANLHGQKCVKGIQGGLVFMGQSTRKMNKKEFADVVTCAEQFGAENSVIFSMDAQEGIRLANQYKEQLSKFNKS